MHFRLQKFGKRWQIYYRNVNCMTPLPAASVMIFGQLRVVLQINSAFRYGTARLISECFGGVRRTMAIIFFYIGRSVSHTQGDTRLIEPFCYFDKLIGKAP
jgi:hypothetical protein